MFEEGISKDWNANNKVGHSGAYVFCGRNGAGIVFYSQLSALWCMQATRENTIKNAKQRMIGTLIGTFYGFVFIVFKQLTKIEIDGYNYLDSVVISGMVIIVIYTSVLIKKKQASYFSCVVFLSIVVNHIGTGIHICLCVTDFWIR